MLNVNKNLFTFIGVEQHKKITKFKNPDYDSATINNDVCLLKVQNLI